MKNRLVVGTMLAGLCLMGCSESTLVRSYPPGAKLFVNESFVGVTPVVFTTPHSRIGEEYRVRIEHDGYAPEEDALRKHICGGRIAGGIFTLGFVLLVRGPTCFVERHDFSLNALSDPTVSGEHGGRQPTVDDRLRRIERLRDQGTINKEEYEESRKEILKGL